MMTDTELLIRSRSEDSIASEVRVEPQIRNGSANSFESATSHDDGYRVADKELKFG